MAVTTDESGRIQPRRAGNPAQPELAPATSQQQPSQAVQPQPQQSQQEKGLAPLLKLMQPEIQRALPVHLNPGRMGRVLLSALRFTPKLAECTPVSFFASVLSCAQLGLEPNTPLGLCYLIPRRSKKTGKTECTLMIGYQGMMELSLRSGKVQSISARVVRAGDQFEFEEGLEPKLRHVPSNDPDREQRKVTHAYAIARIKDVPPVFVVLTKTQIEDRRARSASPGVGPWQTDYEAMCCKTAVRALWRWIPKSIEMAAAIAVDEAPEIDKTTAQAADPDVLDALRAQGYEVIDAEGEVVEGSNENAAG